MRIYSIIRKRIIKWNAKKEAPKLEINKSANDLERVDDISVENNEKEGTGRRLQDKFSKEHTNRKMNLDRRTLGSDRRVKEDPHYKGRARRYTIDRRWILKDRRGNR